MTKIYIITLSLIFLTSCGSANNYEARLNRVNEARFHNAAHKFINRVRPSESMQAGIPKRMKDDYSMLQEEGKYYDLVEIKEENPQNNIPEISKENLTENGDYRGVFKIGDPYEIFGVAYFPQNYDDYEETGVASWYGDDFHGKLTANGEIYNMDEMTAAHQTLPLPSMVRVTNLRNGKTAIVRVNDRGPFAKSRIIDVSEKAAIVLGFRDRGTAEVHIELLKNDTDELLKRLKIKN